MRVFIYIDGDGVGQRLEGLVIDGDLMGASRLSQATTRTIHQIADLLRAARAEIVFAGGDNVLARADCDEPLFERLLQLFHRETGLPASAGIGFTSTEAFLALQIAKSLGGRRLFTWAQAPVRENLPEPPA